MLFTFDVSPVALLAAVAAVQSLFFDYFPGVAKKFEALDMAHKKQLTLILGVVFGVAAFVGSCYGWFTTNIACEPQSIIALVGNIAISVSVGYAFHTTTKPSFDTKEKLGIVEDN